MNLSFYDKLNSVQKNYAQFIAERAKAAGVPPELAVSIAYKESGLNPSVSAGAAGEIGIMQIKPDTAKEMGFSLDDIKDPQKNIDAGLKYLKKSLDMSEGDQRLAAAGYNAGVNHPFFSSKDRPLPETTVGYLKDLKGFGAFTTPAATAAGPAEEPTPVADTASKERAAVDKVFEDVARGRGELIGAGVGAGEAARRLVGPAVKGAARFIGGAAEEGKIAADLRAGVMPGAQPEAPPSGPRAAPPAPGQATTPGGFPRATGPGSATFNYARSYGLPEIEAGRALTTTKDPGGVWDLLGKRQEALTNIQQRFPTETFVENPRFGGLMTPDQGTGAGPRASYVQQPGGLQAIPTRAPVPITPPSKGALEEVTQIFKNMMAPESKLRTVGSSVLRYAAPPLAGYQAGSELGALTHELEKPKTDYTKAALRGVGGLGAIASMFPVTAPIGIPAAVAAPLFVEAIEKGRERPLGQTADMIAP